MTKKTADSIATSIVAYVGSAAIVYTNFELIEKTWSKVAVIVIIIYNLATHIIDYWKSHEK